MRLGENMKTFTGKTAVITGGAGGIGYALAAVCAANGMKIVLSDIETDTLNAAAEKLCLSWLLLSSTSLEK